MKIDLIAGARPNFVKIAAIIHAIKQMEKPIDYRLIHTGQHYDENLSGNLFKDLQLPAPNINLNIGSGTQAEQTAAIIIAYERLLQLSKPDLCLVVGDVTSSMACAITAKKMQVKLAHVEAGIRSNDWKMPKEVNRVLIDSIADYFFTTTRRATDFLLNTGKNKDQVFFVGNTMIDTLLNFKPYFRKPKIWDTIKLKKKEFILLTLHRPANISQETNLKTYVLEILKNSGTLPVIFPAHPRTRKILNKINIDHPRLFITDALSYLEFNYLVENCKAVLTDSGGITEETTVLGIPCLTLRDNTERPETITEGTNMLLGTDPVAIAPAMKKLFSEEWKKGNIPKLWDGKAGERILKVLENL